MNPLIQRLTAGNHEYLCTCDAARRADAPENGQHPYAIVICCSDSRVIPEEIFSAGLGDLFVIRVAGNVLDRHQLGSVEYAAAHLGCRLIVMLGHTGCGAVAAALSGEANGLIRYITYDIRMAIREERDPDRACRLNVLHGLDRLRHEFSSHPEMQDMVFKGASTQQQDTLSDREKDVIIALVQGMANKEIADHLCISINTVITHRRNIARKLQIHSPAGLTIYAIVNGFVDISSVKL